MAENKTSFLLKTAHKSIFNRLSDEEAGKLIKQIFSYVTDENPPEMDNDKSQFSFELIQDDLKADLVKWEKAIEKKSAAGKKSAEQKKHNSTKSTHVESVEQNEQTLTESTEDNKCQQIQPVTLRNEELSLDNSNITSNSEIENLEYKEPSNLITREEKKENKPKKSKKEVSQTSILPATQKEAQIPTENEFVEYSSEQVCKMLKIPSANDYLAAILAKYESWKAAGWQKSFTDKKGNTTYIPIKNWKSTVCQCVPYFQPNKANGHSPKMGIVDKALSVKEQLNAERNGG